METSEVGWKERLRDENPGVRRAAMEEAQSAGTIALPDLLERAIGDPDESLRYKALDAICEIGGPEAVPALVQLVRRVDLDARRYILYNLGTIGTPEAVAEISAALHRGAEPKVQRTAARALAHAQGKAAIPELGDLLGKAEDPTVRRAIAEVLGKLREAGALSPLCRAVVKDANKGVRRSAAGAIRGLPLDWKERASFLLQLLRESGLSRARVDAEHILLAMEPEAGTAAEGPFAVADYLIAKTLEREDASSRAQAVFAELIIGSLGRDMELAGERVNAYQHASQLSDERLQALRIQIGGETALDPVLRELNENLQKNFVIPIQELNLSTEANWKRTIGYSQIGFIVRMVMSVLVFVAGLAFLVASGIRVLFGNLPPEQLLGPGVSFVTALGTVLLLIYTGPLKEIRQSMTDLGATSAAFIAYLHRVLQVSHTYSAYYLKQQMTFQENERSCQLIEDAMRDTVDILLQKSREEAATAEGEAPKKPLKEAA